MYVLRNKLRANMEELCQDSRTSDSNRVCTSWCLNAHVKTPATTKIHSRIPIKIFT